jgi:hypothetical protein
MKRHEFISLLGGAAGVWPLASRAQQGERVRRIGVLMNRAADDPEGQARIAAFLHGLQESGWAVGRNGAHRHALECGRSQPLSRIRAQCLRCGCRAARTHRQKPKPLSGGLNAGRSLREG